MESILRGAATYVFVWVIFRITGKRTLAQITTFDAVLVLIISEATQNAMTDDDNSFTNVLLLIMTMLGIDVLLSCVKQRWPFMERIMDGMPLVILTPAGLRHDAMNMERVDERDILHAARARQGIGALDEVRYAVLEQTGEITIIPKQAT